MPFPTPLSSLCRLWSIGWSLYHRRSLQRVRSLRQLTSRVPYRLCPMPDQLLAITGGGGRIATAIRPLLREHYRIRLLDLREPPTALDGAEFVKADVADLAA